MATNINNGNKKLPSNVSLEDENAKLKRELTLLKVQLQQFQQSSNSTSDNQSSSPIGFNNGDASVIVGRRRSSATRTRSPAILSNSPQFSRTISPPPSPTSILSPSSTNNGDESYETDSSSDDEGDAVEATIATAKRRADGYEDEEEDEYEDDDATVIVLDNTSSSQSISPSTLANLSVKQRKGSLSLTSKRKISSFDVEGLNLFEDDFINANKTSTGKLLVDGEITEDQRRLKLEHVIHRFNKRGWDYVRTPTHPDDNNYTPLHLAFLTANENVATFLLSKCVENEKWYLLTGNSKSASRLIIRRSPFDLAFEVGNIDFVRSMLSFTRQQLRYLEKKNNRRLNRSLSSDKRALNLSSLSSSANDVLLSPTSPPASKTVNAFITSRSRSIKSMNRDEAESNRSAGGSRTSRMSGRSFTVIHSPKNASVFRELSNEGSDTSTDTVFDEFEQDQTLGDESDSDGDYSESKDTKYTTLLSQSDITSLDKDFSKFDDSQYNLNNYNELIRSDKIRTDPMFVSAMTPRPVSMDTTHKILTSVIEKSSLSGVNVVRKANIFKVGQYFTKTSPVEDNDDKMLYEGMLEDDDKLLPHHIRQSVKAISDDFLVLESSLSDRIELIDKSTALRRRLPDLLYEVDLKEHDQRERKRLVQSTKIQKNPFTRDTTVEVTVDPLSCDRKLAEKYMEQEFNAVERKGFIMDVMDELYPIEESKIALKIDIESPDILLNDFVMKDEYLTTTTDLLFSPKSLKLKVLEYIGEPLEDILCSIILYETFDSIEFTRLTETFTFPATDRNMEAYKALFNVDVISDNLIAMVKYSRKFKGEHTDALNDLYVKGDKAKEKDVSIVKAKLVKYFEFSDNIYTYFAWSAFHVNEFKNNTEPAAIPVFLLPNKPGNIHDKILLQSYVNPELRKHKQIPGTFNVVVKELKISSVPRNFIPATGQLVLNLGGVHTPLSRIRSLEYIDSRVLDVENIFVIHPISLNMGSRKDAKNIFITVSLHDNDLDIEENGIQAFYPIINNSTSKMSETGVTFVSQSNTMPDFTEEIKCKIPSTVTPDHHLLFKIYTITHKDYLVPKNGLKTLVGYGYCLLLNDSQLFYGNTEISIYSVKPGTKLGPYLKLTNTKIDGASLKLKVYTNSISHSNQSWGALDSFFTLINSNPDYRTLVQSNNKEIDSLTTIPAHLSAFAPTVFNELFHIMELNSEQRYSSFKTLMRIVNTYKAQNPAVVLMYVKYMFNNCNVCEAILKSMQTLLETDTTVIALIPRCFWFMFSVLFKSIVLHLDQKRNKDMDHGYSFSQSFHDNLSHLLTVSIFDYIRRAKSDKDSMKLPYLAAGVGSFLMHLLSILDKEYVMIVAAKFIRNLSKLAPIEKTKYDAQLAFFKEFFSYKNYILMFLPQTVEDSVQVVEDESLLEENLSINTYTHFIYTSFIDIVLRSLCDPESIVRMKAITSFRELVVMMSNDVRYQTTNFKQRINQIHFEFVVQFLDIFDDWKKTCCKNKKEMSTKLAEQRKLKVATESSIQSKKLSLSNTKQQKNQG